MTIATDVPLTTIHKEESSSSTSSSGTLRHRRVETTNPKGCDWAGSLKWVGVALAILGLIVGVIGGLVYFGQLQIEWTGVGAMTQAIGCYTMLGGLGGTVIISLLLTVAHFLNRSRENAAEGKSQGCCGKPKPLDTRPGRIEPLVLESSHISE